MVGLCVWRKWFSSIRQFWKPQIFFPVGVRFGKGLVIRGYVNYVRQILKMNLRERLAPSLSSFVPARSRLSHRPGQGGHAADIHRVRYPAVFFQR